MKDDPCTFYWQAELANGRTGAAPHRAIQDASRWAGPVRTAAIRRSLARAIPVSAAVPRSRTNHAHAMTGVTRAIWPREIRGAEQIAGPAVTGAAHAVPVRSALLGSRENPRRGRCPGATTLALVSAGPPSRLFRDGGKRRELRRHDLQHKTCNAGPAAIGEGAAPARIEGGSSNVSHKSWHGAWRAGRV